MSNQRPLLFSFDGSDSDAGKFGREEQPLETLEALAVDEANGVVYAIDQPHGAVDRFNRAGEAEDFPALGSSSLTGVPDISFGFSGLAVDNSGGAGGAGEGEQGRLYVSGYRGSVEAFDPEGNHLWTLPSSTANLCGIAVDAQGHLWLAEGEDHEVREFANTGSPPAQINSFSVGVGNQAPCFLGIDQGLASAYVGLQWNSGSASEVGAYKYSLPSGSLDSTLTSARLRGLSIDQSSPSGHIFTLEDAQFGDGRSTFSEYEPCSAPGCGGTLLGTFGTNLLGDGRGIAYDAGSDRVYVADAESASVKVFGARGSGTAPDATIEASDEIRVFKATAHGKVNPLSLPESSYFFEWKQGTGESWAIAESSAPVALPVETNEIPVSKVLIGLKGNTTYQVRLVTVNGENDLRFYSSADTFATPAAIPPSVTIDEPSAITTDSAHISGTVDPHEDEATWRVQLSTDPSCTSGFSDEAAQTIPAGEPGAVAVGFDLEELLPSQHYCVRIFAANSGGGTTSEVKEFETQAVLPTQVFTAYAAPRTDTSARLNAFVNPEGGEATYRFEYSQDGSSWTVLPDLKTPRSRKQITVAEEVRGLQPNTTYHYRFTVESSAGPVQGAEKTFTTRTTAEMQPPQRGVELVSKPDKGNQNLALQRPEGNPPMVSEDGETVLWNLFAGAPEGNSGTEVNFLAKRTPSGWVNSAVVPPAEEQVGEGGYAYKFSLANPNFSRFVFRAAQSGAFSEGPPTFVRIDDEQHEEVLKAFSATFNGGGYADTDMTSDGSHVLTLNPSTRQVEEIGPSSEVVSVMPDGTQSECGVSGFSGEEQGHGAGTEWTATYHRMAITDASRVYFQAMPNGGSCNGNAFGGIFLRDRNAEQTIEVDPATESRGPAMIRATPDGRTLYFVTETSHTSDDLNSTPDIYRWESETGDYTCLTCVVAEADIGRLASGYEPVRISDDFSHIYFSSTKQLVPGYGTAGETNLYVLSDGEIKFIATTNPGSEAAADLTNAALSKNGNVMVFPSPSGHGELTADRLASKCLSGRDGELHPNCEEFYRYEDSTESLECLSCLPGGVTNRSAGSNGVESFYAMSADGSTVAFVSPERLLPQDINGTYDIYEWHNGALQLISDGETIYPSTGIATAPKVYGMDASGQNIFFSLVDSDLTGYEQDGLSNLYDARVGGGFPRPQEAVHCIEESCQGPTEAAPSPGTAGSTVFHGEGNLKAAAKKKGRCARKRGKARSRCLRRNKHKHKRHHHKRHSRQAAKHNAGGSK